MAAERKARYGDRRRERIRNIANMDQDIACLRATLELHGLAVPPSEPRPAREWPPPGLAPAEHQRAVDRARWRYYTALLRWLAAELLRLQTLVAALPEEGAITL